MIEIKHDRARTSITGTGSVVDLMEAYAKITCAVGRTLFKMTGAKELTDGLMGNAWTIARKDVFGEERDDT